MDMDIKKILAECPAAAEMAEGKEILWMNPAVSGHEGEAGSGDRAESAFSDRDIDDAEARLKRFAAFIRTAFPETEAAGGIIESPLTEIPAMKVILAEEAGCHIPGKLFLKQDSHLPISGSVKARGGIYEVLKFAEQVALERGLISEPLDECDYSLFAGEEFRKIMGEYGMAVGSTGNLGLSIGIMGAALGFRTTVHMSMDARQWKKDLLRSKGVNVVEYAGDYGKAVAEGRKLAAADPKCHFVDDENSADLFLGYSVAARRLKAQLDDLGIEVGPDRPLYVYIPCGVGGAPGGIAFGLHRTFGRDAHVYFAEPVKAPCMTLGLATGLYEGIAVSDIGSDGKTEADGLAVGRASGLVSREVKDILEGCFTINDDRLFVYLKSLADAEGILIEPSACAGFPGPGLVSGRGEIPEGAIHILWATGGGMVPQAEMDKYISHGKALMK